MAVDLSVLMAAVDFSTAAEAVLSVAAALSSLYVVSRAAVLVLATLREGDYREDEVRVVTDEEAQQWFASSSKEGREASGVTCWQDFKNL